MARASTIISKCAAPSGAAACLAALLVVAMAANAVGSAAAAQEDPVNRDLDALVAQLASEQPGALRPAYDFFLKSMEDHDGASALQIARAMHERSSSMFDSGEVGSTVWSAFCLEGALRRGATDKDLEQRFDEASRAIRSLMDHPRTSKADRLALIQRHAIVAAGFDRRGTERAYLGAALAQGGIDGAQISGLARLCSAPENGAVDWETAEALFASLLDRAPSGALGQPSPPSVDPSAAPWALRGHGLAVLGALRSNAALTGDR